MIRTYSHSIIWILLLGGLLLTFLLPACVTRYTKAFFLPEYMPNDMEFRDKYSFESFLPEKFHNWLVGVSCWSVWKNQNTSQYGSDEYDLSILFVHPDDTAQGLRSLTPRADESSHDARVDSILIEFEPGGEKHTLHALAQRTRLERRVQFDLLHVPDDVQAIRLQFTAWLVNPDGSLEDGRTFECRLEKYYEKERRILPQD